MKNILYAAYGSNLLKERFMTYINGGTYGSKYYKECKNKEKPEDLEYIFVPYRLYFAKSSSRWDNKGVVFLSCEEEKDKKYYALVRLWKITEEQFNWIWYQEGKTWYPAKLYLGENYGIETYTLTGCWLKEKNRPAKEYIQCIKLGLKETTGWSEDECNKYLSKFMEEINASKNLERETK